MVKNVESMGILFIHMHVTIDYKTSPISTPITLKINKVVLLGLWGLEHNSHLTMVIIRTYAHLHVSSQFVKIIDWTQTHVNGAISN